MSGHSKWNNIKHKKEKADAAKAALGENFGAAQLPCITINGEQKQMKAFGGSKAIGVNALSKNPKAAMQLAAFLSSVEAQKAHYEMRGIIPAATILASDPVVVADVVAVGYLGFAVVAVRYLGFVVGYLLKRYFWV